MFRLVLATAMLASLSLSAAPLTLPVNVITGLPSCGGTVKTEQVNGQINLIFAKVKNCSNFDITSRQFGILDANYKDAKLQSAHGEYFGSFTIPKSYIERGINEITVEIRSNSKSHLDTINLVFNEGARPVPAPTASLKGSCADGHHTNFVAAKDFAYRVLSHLNDAQATEWAYNYNRTHRCGTIGEFRARFEVLKDYAYKAEYLDLSPSDAAEAYALKHAEEQTVAEVRAQMALFPHALEFFFDAKYLDMSTKLAHQRTGQWIARGCGDTQRVGVLKGQFTKEYQFAYSPSGLNQSDSQARAYAISRISHLTPCADLLRK